MQIHALVPAGQQLKSAYLGRLERNRSYSLRAFARDLNLSHSHLGRVIAGRRNLSLRQGVEICERLAFGDEERQAFLSAVAQAAVNRAEPRARPESSVLTLEVDQFRFLSEWYHGAILELAKVADFNPQAGWIARKLGLKTREVERALARLKRLRLIEKTEGGWRPTHRHIAVPSGASRAIRAYHRQMIDKALLQLAEEIDPASRDISGTTIAIEARHLPAVREKIRRFRKSLMEYAAKTPADSLFQLNVQFFPLAKGNDE